MNDSARLEWLFDHGGADLDYRVVDGHIAFFYIRWFSDSDWYIVRGKDWRECIDNAIDGKAEKVGD
jgi:hypothetical protein